MKKVLLSEILTASVCTFLPNTNISEVLSEMARQSISCVICVDKHNRPVGILTERDAVRLLAQRQRLDATCLGDVMSAPVFSAPSTIDFREAYRLLQQRGLRHMAVTDDGGYLLGVVTEGDFLDCLDIGDLAEFKSVDKVMSRNIVTIDVEASVTEALGLMSRNSYSCVIITRQQQPCGILTERDAVRLVPTLAQGDIPLSKLVSTALITAPPGTTLPDVIQQMDHYRVRHLVIADGEKLVGLVTRHDIVKTLQGSYVNYLHETIQEQRKELFQLSQQHNLFRLHDATLAAAANAILIADRKGLVQWANPACARLTGYRLEEIVGGHDLFQFSNHPPEFYENLWQIILAGEVWQGEIVSQRKDGTRYPEEMTITPVRIGDEKVTHFIAVKQEISERKQAEEKLRLAANVFTHAREGICITDSSANIIAVNQSFTAISGYSSEEVLGKNPRILGSGRQDKAFYTAMWHDLQAHGYWCGEVWNRHKSGHIYIEMLTISAVRDGQGKIQNYIALFSDITTLKEYQNQLERIAHYDGLTGLPNRLLLADRLKLAMRQASRRGQQVAVVYLDLDGFKAVNDRHTHEVGDQLLIAISKRLNEALREGDTLARIGGDEFVAVLVDLPDIESCTPVLQRLLVAAADPVWLGALELHVSASIGVGFYPQNEEVDADQLVRQADQAMYQAKQSGKSRYHLFDADLERDLRNHHETIEHIRRGLFNDEFLLYYQPKINMRSGELLGAEALIRWKHPEQGLIAPALFLSAIENHSLYIELGSWVIETALTQMEAWHTNGLSIPVSVNVGAMQLLHPDFVQHLREMLSRHPRVNPGDLELEILETSALEDIELVLDVMTQCHDLGVTFAVDDFGTGYSSLTYLKKLPASVLKIDQSFVRNMLHDSDDLAILTGVLGLAKAFNRKVIAEGVETQDHGELLLHLGCTWGQGYAFARPMPASEMTAWAASTTAKATETNGC